MINGVDGFDTFLLENINVSDVQLSFVDNGAVEVRYQANDFIDSLINIESIHFSDGVVSIASESAAEQLVDKALVGRVASLYEAALDRNPDVGGLNFWVNTYTKGQSVLDIAQNFIDSEEFTSRFDVTTNEDFVNTLYLNILGRTGDEEGVAWWLTALSTEEDKKAQVLLEFSDSVENQTHLTGLIDSISYQLSDTLWSFD